MRSVVYVYYDERVPPNINNFQQVLMLKNVQNHVNYCYISSPRAIKKNAKNKYHIPSYREKIYLSNDVIYRRGKNTGKK